MVIIANWLVCQRRRTFILAIVSACFKKPESLLKMKLINIFISIMLKLTGIFLLLSISYSSGQGVGSDIKSKAKEWLELSSYTFTGDTLRLVASTKFLYYPFGEFHHVKELKKRFVNAQYAEKEGLPYVVDANSYIKFFYNTDKDSFELLYGKISNPNFEMTNGIKIGMTKKELFDTYFTEAIDKMDSIKVLTVESALLGIWHYYTFENNILVSICLDTDYQIDKGIEP